MAAVPPTTHSLPKPQRLRLMRSTRKLTALLGTTPLLVDARDDLEPLRTPDAHSPLEPIENDACPATIASILSLSLSSTTNAEYEQPGQEDTGADNPAALVFVTTPTSAHRPTLLLRMNTVPLRCNSSNNRRRANSQAWGRPASFASPPPSPSSPVFPPSPVFDCRPDVARRRKMARVTRTLGENVPPGLVFRPDTTLSPSPSRPSIDSDASYSELDSPSDDEDDKPKLSLDASEIRFAKVSLGPLDSVVELADTAAPSPSSPTTCPTPSTRPSLSSDRTAWIPHITSIRRSASQRRNPNPRLHPQPQPAVMRTEPGWTGAWNQEEGKVVRGLRELK
ncbi:hypothetical protein DFH06DRAFT_1327695 [Mycena polygramma]|nr:hypothetical protein DFH06DRAFT_1327695 [Mycena polygramma]